MNRKVCWWTAGCVICVALCGCVSANSDATIPTQLSPDGRIACCGWSDAVSVGVLSPGIAVTEYVVWCDPDNPRDVHCVRIRGEFSAALIPTIDAVRQIAFAPDSKHIAVCTLNRCIVIDTKTGSQKRVTPGGDYISSFVWTGPDTFLYVTQQRDGDGYRRRVWRQSLSAAPGKRQRVYDGPGVDMLDRVPLGREEWTLEQWSPDGRYAIFVQPYPEGQLHLLDATNGRTWRIAGRQPWRAYDGRGSKYWIAWAPDGSRAFCVSATSKKKYREEIQAILLDPTAHSAVDIGRNLQQLLPNNIRTVEPVWTDGGDVLLTLVGGKRLLVRPDASAVRPAPPPPPDRAEDRKVLSADGKHIIEFISKDEAIVRPVPAKKP